MTFINLHECFSDVYNVYVNRSKFGIKRGNNKVHIYNNEFVIYAIILVVTTLNHKDFDPWLRRKRCTNTKVIIFFLGQFH